MSFIWITPWDHLGDQWYYNFLCLGLRLQLSSGISPSKIRPMSDVFFLKLLVNFLLFKAANAVPKRRRGEAKGRGSSKQFEQIDSLSSVGYRSAIGWEGIDLDCGDYAPIQAKIWLCSPASFSQGI
jgi:hypothetical protein